MERIMKKFYRLGIIFVILMFISTGLFAAKNKGGSGSAGSSTQAEGQTSQSGQTQQKGNSESGKDNKTGSNGNSDAGDTNPENSSLFVEVGQAASDASNGGDLSGYSLDALAGALAGAGDAQTAEAIQNEIDSRMRKGEDAAASAGAEWISAKNKLDALNKKKAALGDKDGQAIDEQIAAQQRIVEETWNTYQANINSWKKDCETLATAMAIYDTVGDPVKISSGDYVYEQTDYQTIDYLTPYCINREYDFNQKNWSSFGYGYVSSLDSRIVRLHSANFENYLPDLDETIKIWKECISIIDEYNEKFSSYPQGENEKKEYEQNIIKAETVKNNILSISEKNKAIMELNKYSAYGYFNTFDSSSGNSENLVFIDKKGQIIYCYFDGTCWIPSNLLTSKKVKIFGLREDGNLSFSQDISGGYIAVYSSGLSITYDKYGIIARETDIHENKIEYSTKNGRVYSIKNKTGELIEIKRDSNGYITKIQGPVSGSTLYTYSNNRLSECKKNNGIETKYFYNPDGSLSSIKKGDGSSINIQYEYLPGYNKNMVTSVTDEENYTETFSYDYNLKTVNHRTISGNDEIYKYDEKGNIVYQKDEKGIETFFTFDNSGVPVEVLSDGKKSTYIYDENFNPIKKIYTSGEMDLYEYNSYGLITKITDRDGNYNEYKYDNHGNLIETSYEGNVISVMEYYPNGLLKSLVEKEILTELKYDSFGQVLTQTKSFGSESISQKWKYDSKERTIEYKNDFDEITRFEYEDPYNDKNNLSARIKETQILDNRLKNELIYNSRNWLIEQIQTDLKTGVSYKKEIFYDHKGNIIKVLFDGKVFAEYAYTPYGNLAEYTIWNASGEGLKSSYKYDKKHRLLTEKRQFVFSEVESENKQNQESQSETIIWNEYEDLPTGFIMHTGVNGQKNYSYEYNSDGKIICVTRPDGSTEKRFYTKKGEIASTIDTMYGSTKFDYSYDGTHEVYFEDFNGNFGKWKYAPDGRLIKSEMGNGNIKERFYDWKGNIILEKGNDYTEEYVYDNKNREISHKLFDLDGYIHYEAYGEYDDEQNAVVYRRGSGRHAIENSFILDAWNRPVKMDYGDGSVVYEYDYLGNITRQIDSDGSECSWKYTPTGKVSQIINKDGSSYDTVMSILNELIGYYNNGRYIEVKNFNLTENSITKFDKYANKTRVKYDDKNRVIFVAKYDTGERYYQYSKNDNYNETKIIDGIGNSYLYRFDNIGNLIYEKNQNGSEAEYGFDSWSRLAWQKDFEGHQGKYRYDDNSRSSSLLWDNGEEYIIKRNCLNHITDVVSSGANLHYEYSSAGTLISFTDKTADVQVEYKYDLQGRLVEKISDLFHLVYEYDTKGRNIQTTDLISNSWIKVDYDVLGREIKRLFSNGVTVTRQYNFMGQLESIVSKEPYGGVIDSSFIVYDITGKISAVGKKDGSYKYFVYDELGRLVKSVFPYSKEQEDFFLAEAVECDLYESDKTESHEIHYSLPFLISEELNLIFKKNGNDNFNKSQLSWIEEYSYTENGAVASVSTNDGKIFYEYDKENRLIHKHGGNTASMGITYDWTKNGNLYSVISKSGKTVFEYNRMNCPVQIRTEDYRTGELSIINYEYDGLGRRIEESDFSGNAWRFVYDGLSTNVIACVPLFDNQQAVTSYSAVKTNSEEENRYRYISESYSDLNNSRYRKENDFSRSNYVNHNELEKKIFSILDVKGEKGAFLIKNRMSVSGTSVEYLLNDFLGNSNIVRTDESGTCVSYTEYDVWGNSFGDKEGCSYSLSNSYLSNNLNLYNLGIRDYSPQMKSFITKDPLRDGENWFAYCSCDPVNYSDNTGFFKNGMSDSQKYAYCMGIANVMAFDFGEYSKTGISAGIPKIFDCADVAATVDYLASTSAQLTNYSDMMNKFAESYTNELYEKAAKSLSTANYRADDKSGDVTQSTSGYNRDGLRFITESRVVAGVRNLDGTTSKIDIGDVNDQNTITQYEYNQMVTTYAKNNVDKMKEQKATAYEALRNPDVCTPGVVLAWSQTSQKLNLMNFDGHVLIVTARTFDDNGAVTGFMYMEGHSKGNRTEQGYMTLNSNGKMVSQNIKSNDWYDQLDSWVGNYLGAFEIQREGYSAAKCKD